MSTADEGSDISVTAQLIVFLTGDTDQVEIMEEFVVLMSMTGTTTGQDIFDARLKFIFDLNLDVPW